MFSVRETCFPAISYTNKVFESDTVGATDFIVLKGFQMLQLSLRLLVSEQSFSGKELLEYRKCTMINRQLSILYWRVQNFQARSFSLQEQLLG